MGEKLGISQWKKDICWGCFRAGIWNEYLDTREWQQSGDTNVINNLHFTCLKACILRPGSVQRMTQCHIGERTGTETGYTLRFYIPHKAPIKTLLHTNAPTPPQVCDDH